MSESFQFDDKFRGHIRPSWNETKMLIRGPLTDKKIAQYQKQGWYSEDFRQMRRQRMNRSRRSGNFLQNPEGRLIYNPS